MSHRNLVFVLGLLAISTLFVACNRKAEQAEQPTATDTAAVTRPDAQPGDDPSSHFPPEDEYAPDADGDGFSDFYEQERFSPESPLIFNHLIADVPRIEISISEPRVTSDYSEGVSEHVSNRLSRGEAFSKGYNTSQNFELSLGIEATVGGSTTASVGTQGGVSGTVHSSATVRAGTSFGVQSGTSREEQRNFQRDVESGSSKDKTETGGRIEVTARVENLSHFALDIEELVLNATFHPKGTSQKVDVGGLTFDSDTGFPTQTLSPHGTGRYFRDGLPFDKTDLNVFTIKNLLASDGELRIKAVTWDLVDPNDSWSRNFARHEGTINAKTATVSIDYGPDPNQPGKERRELELYHVATGPGGRSVDEIFREILKIDYNADRDFSTDTKLKKGLNKVRDVKANPKTGGYWVVAHTTPEGTTHHHPLKESYDFAGIELRPRHVLQLVYVSDEDQDRLMDRAELALGTRPDKANSDEDELPDGDEVDGWKILIDGKETLVRSNPLLADTDDDGVLDHEEKRAKTDPAEMVAVVLPPEKPPNVEVPTDAELYLAFTSADLTAKGARDKYGNLTVADMSGNGRNGRYYLASYDLDRLNIGNSAANLAENHGNSYYGGIVVEHVPVSISFTFAAWINVQSLQSQRIMGQGDWFSLFAGSGGRCRFGWTKDTNGQKIMPIKDIDGKMLQPVVEDPATPPRNEWVFYAGVCEHLEQEKATVLRLYRDGDQVSVHRLEKVVVKNPGKCKFYIGNFSQRWDQCNGPPNLSDKLEARKFQGKVDDVRVFDRALSKEEIEALFEERKSGA